MAKESKLARNEKRAHLIVQYAAKRRELRAVIRDPNASDDAKMDAYRRLQRIPRDSSPTRFVNRCQVSGRPRAYMRDFGVSRIVFRELANQGMLPGVKKSSW
ncbi:MAG: 30S ribosomal protein S14 [Chloroflexi bacterium]|nr:30S ribosomal protein S14 [Chloroflexota bacterium]MQC19195.1 30S ribosomal protein S14 [Chloroflexota bacterium]